MRLEPTARMRADRPTICAQSWRYEASRNSPRRCARKQTKCPNDTVNLGQLSAVAHAGTCVSTDSSGRFCECGLPTRAFRHCSLPLDGRCNGSGIYLSNGGLPSGLRKTWYSRLQGALASQPALLKPGGRPRKGTRRLGRRRTMPGAITGAQRVYLGTMRRCCLCLCRCRRRCCCCCCCCRCCCCCCWSRRLWASGESGWSVGACLSEEV
jgi:hypothetical protein